MSRFGELDYLVDVRNATLDVIGVICRHGLPHANRGYIRQPATPLKRDSLMSICKCLLASMLALSIATAVSSGEPVIEVEGDWVGGFDREQESVFVRVRISRQDGELRGTCDITGESLLPEMGKQLTSVLSDDDRVRFVLPRKSGELVFEGKLTDQRIDGAVIQNTSNAALHLTRITPVDATKYQGVYRAQGAHDEVTYIGKGTIYPDILFFMDFADGKFDALFPSSDTAFFAGPSLLVTRPVKLRVAFSLNDDKQATSYRLSAQDGRELAAERILFKEQELMFMNDATALEGTLILPHGDGPHPLAVFIPPSTGYANREMSRMFAEYFAYNGVAGFIYDKRGTGSSKGNWLEASFDVLADDALSGLRMLKQRTDIDGNRIGLFGQSQAGWVAALAASQSSDVAFLINQSGPGVTPEAQELYRIEHWLRADGFERAEVEEAIAYTRFRYECARTDMGWDRLLQMDEEANSAPWSGYVGVGIGRDNPFWKFFNLIRDFDPAPVLANVNCPVLAIYGERDTFLPVDRSVSVWRESLRKAGNRDVTFKVFSRGGHSLQQVETGGVKEMTRLTRFVDGYFATMRDWLRKRVDIDDIR